MSFVPVYLQAAAPFSLEMQKLFFPSYLKIHILVPLFFFFFLMPERGACLIFTSEIVKKTHARQYKWRKKNLFTTNTDDYCIRDTYIYIVLVYEKTFSQRISYRPSKLKTFIMIRSRCSIYHHKIVSENFQLIFKLRILWAIHQGSPI